MSRRKWTKEKIHIEALKYKSRKEFQVGNNKAYSAAQRKKIISEVCSHMEIKLMKWTKKLLQKEASKYKRRYHFQNEKPAAYSAARRRGLVDEICSHMDVNNKWDLVSFLNKAKERHGGKYIYNIKKFKSIAQKEPIKCVKHDFIFYQVLSDHLRGDYPCPKCRTKYKAYSFEDFEKKSKQIHNKKYEYIENTYVNTKSIVSIVCKKHGVFEQKAANHLTGKGCRECGIIKQKESNMMTTSEFIKRAQIIHSERYIYKNTIYNGTKNNVIIECMKHGIFEQKSKTHLQGCGCPKCGRDKRSKNSDNFIIEAKRKHNNKYNYTKTVYKNNRSKVIITCKKHGDFQQLPNNHLSGNGCLNCRIDGTIKKDFFTEAKKKHGDIYDYSDVNYINRKNKIKIICKKHGTFEQSPANHLIGQGCPECGKIKTRIKKHEFIKRANKVHKGYYDYSNLNFYMASKKLSIICPVHGVFNQNGSAHLIGQGCPRCKSSKGEEKIMSWLLSNSIGFEAEKKFKKCKFVKQLRFDFVLNKSDGRLIAIEFQGKQHYKVSSNNFFGGKEAFIKRQKRDQIKRDFCKKEGIKLIEIPYWDFDNIEEILTKELDIT